MNVTTKKAAFFALLTMLVMSTRFLALPMNFTPIFGWAILSGAYFSKNKWGLAIPLLAYIFVDLFVQFHPGALIVWGSFYVISHMSAYVVKKGQVSYLRVLMASILSPLFFFIITNFEVWMNSGLYELTLSGLMKCYMAALPFYHNSQLASLLFTTVFFTSWHYLKKYNSQFESSVIAKN